MAAHGKQSGTVLVLALMFCAASSILMLLQLETGILETAMFKHSLSKKQLHINQLYELSQIERQLATGSLTTLPSNIEFVEWVPDTLLCQEQDGILYYRITQHKTLPDGAQSQVLTTYAVRGSLPKGQQPNDNCIAEPQVIPLSIQGDHPAIVRNGILIVNDDNYVMLYDVASLQFLRQEKLVPVSFSEPVTAQTGPKMRVRKPIEKKRLILCPTANGWAQAEIEVDYRILGRRTWHEV